MSENLQRTMIHNCESFHFQYPQKIRWLMMVLHKHNFSRKPRVYILYDKPSDDSMINSTATSRSCLGGTTTIVPHCACHGLWKCPEQDTVKTTLQGPLWWTSTSAWRWWGWWWANRRAQPNGPVKAPHILVQLGHFDVKKLRRIDKAVHRASENHRKSPKLMQKHRDNELQAQVDDMCLSLKIMGIQPEAANLPDFPL